MKVKGVVVVVIFVLWSMMRMPSQTVERTSGCKKSKFGSVTPTKSTKQCLHSFPNDWTSTEMEPDLNPCVLTDIRRMRRSGEVMHVDPTGNE